MLFRSRAKEYYWREEANRQPETSAARVAALEKAFAIEPLNPATSYGLGEALRLQSWEGNEDYADTAKAAMKWFEVSAKLNPYDGYNFLRTGMCLDWIHQSEQAAPFFDRAMKLDPNGYFTTAYLGWHYVQIKDYAAAKVCFDRSMCLNWEGNVIALSYRTICDNKLRADATGEKEAIIEKEIR